MRLHPLRQTFRVGSALAALVLLTGCSSSTPGEDDPAARASTPVEAPSEDASMAAPAAGPAEDETTPATDETVPAEDGSGVLVQFRGEQLTASQESDLWACATSADGQFASVMFLDDAGNDVSINYDANAETNASLTLADGTTWNQTEDGVLNVSQQSDGTYRMSIQLTEVDSGESESMDVRLSCG